MLSAPSGQCAWITGASSGIGRALARRMAGAGWTVVAVARTLSQLERLAAEDPGRAGRIVPFALDVTDAAAVSSMVDRIEREVGPIALAVLNAGSHRPIVAVSPKLEDFRELVELNLMGTVHSLIAVQRHMLKRGKGHIAIVSSLAGYRGLPTAAAYGMTKAGLINMAESLQPELAVAGIKLQIVNPGFVRTPLTNRNRFAMPFLISADEAAEAILRGFAGNRFEIAFPRRFAYLMKIYRLLPYRVAFSIARRLRPPR